MKENIHTRDPEDILIHARILQNYLRSDEEFKTVIYPEALKMAKAILGPLVITDADRRMRWEEHKKLDQRLALAGLDADLHVVDKNRWALAVKQMRETLPKPRFDEVKQLRDIAMGVTAPEPEPMHLVIGARRPVNTNNQVAPSATFNLKRNR